MSGDGAPAAKKPKDEKQYSVVDDRKLENNFFLKQSDVLDFCLVVEGRELWVSKHFMAMCSPFFKNLCFNESFKEAKDGKVEMKGKKFADVLELLEVLIPHPNTKKISDVSEVPKLIRMAVEWQIECVIVQCWDCLLAAKLSTGTAFRLLEVFDLLPLKEIPVKVLQHVVDSAVAFSNFFSISNLRELDKVSTRISRNLAVLLYRAFGKRQTKCAYDGRCLDCKFIYEDCACCVEDLHKLIV